MHGLRIDADFTEDVVGFALESFLTVMSFPRHRFSIEPFSRAKERWLGADARLYSEIQGFRPFYMQFKRPSAYPDVSSSGVIKDRKKLSLQTSPRALYFDLRGKQPHHRDFQHNVLLRLRARLRAKGIGDAAYVCPLFLDRSVYRFHLHWSGLSLWPRFWRRYPWDVKNILLKHPGTTFHFYRIPVFAEHMTVPPHLPIGTAKHRYSFTEAGTELCFHSPESLPQGSASLAEFLAGVSDGFLNGGKKIQRAHAGKELRDLIKSTGVGESKGIGLDFATGDDPIGNWLAWGDYLQRIYGINQYALVNWKGKELD